MEDAPSRFRPGTGRGSLAFRPRTATLSLSSLKTDRVSRFRPRSSAVQRRNRGWAWLPVLDRCDTNPRARAFSSRSGVERHRRRSCQDDDPGDGRASRVGGGRVREQPCRTEAHAGVPLGSPVRHPASVGACRFQQSDVACEVRLGHLRKHRSDPLRLSPPLTSAEGSQQQDPVGLRLSTNPASELRIAAQRMIGQHLVGSTVTRTVAGGPGPSIINLPTPGCWRLTLRLSGHADHIDLQYSARR